MRPTVYTYIRFHALFISLCTLILLMNTSGCRDDWRGMTPPRWIAGEHTPPPQDTFGDQQGAGAPNNTGVDGIGDDVLGNTGSSSDTIPHRFISGFQLYTCDSDPPTLLLPRNTPNTGCHATVHATPYWEDDDGNMEEVDGALSWFSDAPEWATVDTPPWSSDHQVAYGMSTQDLFAVDGVREPTATLIGCATNTCLPNDVGCALVVCTDPITLLGVANLEGVWWSITDADLTATPLTILQDGRTFTIAPWMEEGSITGANVQWDAGQEIYQGVLASRTYMSGLRWDDMGLNVIGTWEAWR